MKALLNDKARSSRLVAALAVFTYYLLNRGGFLVGATPEEGEAEPEGGHHHGGHHDAGHGGGHGHGHGYQVFHYDFERIQYPFIIALWIFVSSLAKIGFHMTPKLESIFPESCLLIVVGIFIGFLLKLTSETVPTTLTPDTFFLYMLPPIILDAGYFMPNRLFFDHLGTILLMAIGGTIWNMLTIGSALYGCGYLGAFGDDYPNILEMFLFASVIVAVDPVAVLAVFEEIHVEEILYIVVFGESLLNDAVTVVLYNMFDSYVSLGESNIGTTEIAKGFASFVVVAGGGTVIGIIWGYVTGFVTRFTNHARILEPLFVLIMAYMAYLNAEIFHLSGILAITFCGITMKNYVERNICSKSQTTLKYGLKMLSSSSETIIFMFLGVATIHDEHVWNWAFVGLTILFCTLFRVIGVILLSAIANQYRLHKLKMVDQFVMMYGGLRGAVAFALVLLIDENKVPHARMFVTTTIAVVYWTVFLQGITIKPLVQFLNIKTSAEKDPTMNERIAGRFMDHVVSGMEGILGELGNLRMRDMYKYIDTKYIKPCLLRENQYKDHKIIETFENLTNRDAVEFMKRNPTQFAGMRSMAELAAGGASTASGLDMMGRTNDGFENGIFPEDMENMDMKKLQHAPTEKDLDAGRVHRLLSENMFMPKARPRRMSYSRHGVNPEDLAMNHEVNYRMHMQVRRMVSEKEKKARRKKREQKRLDKLNGGEVIPEGDEWDGSTRTSSTVRFENEYQKTSSNGNAKLMVPDFPAPSRTPPGLRVPGNSKLLQDEKVHDILKSPNTLGVDLPDLNEISEGDEDEGDDGGLTFDTGRQHSFTPDPPRNNILARQQQRQQTTIAGLSGFSNPAYVVDSADYAGNTDDSDEAEYNSNNRSPTAQELAVPWKRNGSPRASDENEPVRQSEFAGWVKNKERYFSHEPASGPNSGDFAAGEREDRNERQKIRRRSSTGVAQMSQTTAAMLAAINAAAIAKGNIGEDAEDEDGGGHSVKDVAHHPHLVHLKHHHRKRQSSKELIKVTIAEDDEVDESERL